MSWTREVPPDLRFTSSFENLSPHVLPSMLERPSESFPGYRSCKRLKNKWSILTTTRVLPNSCTFGGTSPFLPNPYCTLYVFRPISECPKIFPPVNSEPSIRIVLRLSIKRKSKILIVDPKFLLLFPLDHSV